MKLLIPILVTWRNCLRPMLRNWVFFPKLVCDVRAVNTNTKELETIWKLNMSRTLNGWLRWPISLVNFRLTLQNPKLKILRLTRVLAVYPERKKPVKNETFRQSSTYPPMPFLNIKMAGWGRYHECMKMLVSSDCLSPESSNNSLPERNG